MPDPIITPSIPVVLPISTLSPKNIDTNLPLKKESLIPPSIPVVLPISTLSPKNIGADLPTYLSPIYSTLGTVTPPVVSHQGSSIFPIVAVIGIISFLIMR